MTPRGAVVLPRADPRGGNAVMRDRIEFTPVQGLLAVGRRLAAHLGLGEIWQGEEGLEGVVRQKLKEVGMPERVSVQSRDVTVRGLAENAGFIKRRPHRRLKA